MIRIDDVQEIPLFLLSDISGKPLTTLLAEESGYYSLFAKVLEGQSKYFSKLLTLIENSNSSHKLIQDRALIISIMEELNIDYHHAWGIYPHVKDKMNPLSLEDALKIVLNNYSKLLTSEVEAPPILVKIDENGRARIVEGIHRATIAMLQNRTSMTCIVIEKHESWISFMDLISSHSNKMYGDVTQIYHRIEHPDFKAKQVIREDRSTILKDLADRVDITTVVDLGSFYGEIAHFFAHKGKNVTAVEYDNEFAFVIEKLSATYNLNLTIICSEINDFLREFEGSADLAVALSIAYHLKRRDPDSFKFFMTKIKQIFKHVLIDTENKTGILDDSILIAEFSGWTYKLLFEGSDKRNIYLFSRDN
jgi:hypothetical protein